MAACEKWQLLLVVSGVLAAFEHAYGYTEDHRICGTLPEIYFANVIGRIPGGSDIILPGNQKPCRQKPLKERYREVDGRCNHPLDFGSAMKPVKRYIKPYYQDPKGYNTPRSFSERGKHPLPSPRAISTFIHTDRRKMDRYTMWVMQLGQFIDHDITSAPVPTEHNSSIRCCGLPPDQKPEECFSIEVPRNDRVFGQCMEFVRSEPWKDDEGQVIYPREQLNALTAFLDGSAIYGSNEETLARLRTSDGKGPLLKTMVVNGKERLPQDVNADRNMCLVSRSRHSYCQLAGDERVNEQPGLGSAHLLFHLFHNYIVKALTKGILGKDMHQVLDHEVEAYLQREPTPLHEYIFQEARRIVGAVLQKITYCDWLPLIVGPALIRKYSLDCHGRSRYNKFVDPRISNSFLTVAFRFGHSLIPNQVSINHVKLELKDQFMVPDPVQLYYESILEGMQDTRSQMKFDRHYNDLDLFVGGLLEVPVRGGIVGDTFGNILANQFADLKFGDAYFFMDTSRARGFTNEQLRSIKKYTLRDIVCMCGGVKKSQRNIFRAPMGRNLQEPCDARSEFNIAPWY
ncbi:chorion peroxidase [Elysia marginata]|uniref:Chorion peroxidase n=1 Tax=Elysia marginata TaxID=1093978 RepID=A0AAV4FM69_9GAST|nr:chorion peroxidase [Elysia marginata]